MKKEAELNTNPLLEILKSIQNKQAFWFLKNLNEKDLIALQNQNCQNNIIIKDFEISFSLETLTANDTDKLNEDAVLFLPFGKNRILFAMLDGASSQVPIEELEENNIKGGWYCSHLFSLGFKQSEEYKKLCEENYLSAEMIMRVVNQWIYENQKKVRGIVYDDVLSIAGMAATFCLLDFEREIITIAHVADTVLAFEYDDGTIEILTDDKNKRFDEERTEFINSLYKKHNCIVQNLKKHPQASIELKTFTQNSFRKKINTYNGCGILNGMPELFTNNLIQVLEIPIKKKIKRIGMFSDGGLLPEIKNESDTKSIVRKLLSSTKNRLLTGRKKLLNEFKNGNAGRTKIDDASIIEITIRKR